MILGFLAALGEACRLRRPTAQEKRLYRKALGKWRPYMVPNGGLVRKGRLRPLDFNPGQLAIGTRVELEHTNRPAVALEVAMAHLAEDPAYYCKLEKLGL